MDYEKLSKQSLEKIKKEVDKAIENKSDVVFEGMSYKFKVTLKGDLEIYDILEDELLCNMDVSVRTLKRAVDLAMERRKDGN